MSTNIALIAVSLLLSGLCCLLFRIKNVALRTSLLVVVIGVSMFIVHGYAVSVERLNNYSNYSARYLRAISSLRVIAENESCDELKSAIVSFDAAVQSAPQSSANLQDALLRLELRDSGSETPPPR